MSSEEKITVLLVDDDPFVRKTIAEYLTRESFDVLEAQDGQDAQQKIIAHGNSISIILLDMILPDCDGLNLIPKVKNIKDIPIIIISSRGDDVDRIIGIEAGADDYVVKPVTPRELDEDPRWGRLPNIRTGKVGIEQALEQNLRGSPGLDRIEINARGKAVRIINDKNPVQGNDARLTLNMEVQAYAYNRLRAGNSEIITNTADIQRALQSNEELRAHFAAGDNLVLRDANGRFVPGESGSAIVMDIRNGNVISMVSAPSYDPNQFSERLLTRDWKRLSNHPRTPLLNRAISGL